LILAAARREARHRLHRYLPSLAMAATVVLALGIVLRLTVPGRDLSEPAREPAASSTPALLDQPEVMRALPNDSDAPAAADAAAPLLESTTVANDPLPAASEGGASAGRATLQRLAPESAAQACAPLRAGEPGPWLDCIRARLDAGAAEEARAELALLGLAHPDFPIPAELTARLQP
jgi:hypothetical protein